MPTSAGAHGGSIITVIGSDFSPSRSLLCVFSSESDNAIFVNASALLCQVPRGAVGVVPFELLDGREVLNSVSLTFEYLEENLGSLISIVPSLGPVDGQTLVTISGTSSFGTGAVCVLDGQRITASWVIDSQITCSLPANEAGKVQVFVDGSHLRGNFVEFLYRQYMFIMKAEPVVLPAMQAKIVTIHGSRFLNSSLLACRIGSTSVVSAQFVSNETLLCPVPGLRDGNHSLEISENSQQFVMLPESIHSVSQLMEGIMPSH